MLENNGRPLLSTWKPGKRDLQYAAHAANTHRADIQQIATGLLELGSLVMGIAGTLIAGQNQRDRNR